MRRHLALCLLTACLTACRAEPEPPPAVEVIGRLDHLPLDESSGLVRSRQFPGVWWTHNDSGGDPVLYAVEREGKLIREVRVESASNRDWEDLAADEAGHLWLGDIGDNRSRRADICVYRVDEPDPRRVTDVTAETFHFRYPDGAHNAEGLFARTGRLYVVTKEFGNRPSAVYSGVPRLVDTVTLELVAKLHVDELLTGADLSPDGTRLALVGYRRLFVFTGGATPEELLTKTPRVLTLTGAKGTIEAVGFDGDDLILTCEQRDIYRVPAATWQAAPEQSVMGEEG